MSRLLQAWPAMLPALVLLTAPAHADEQGAALYKNPFKRPIELAGVNNAGTPPQPAQLDRPLVLRGILAAGEDSLADIGGEIIGVGEEVNGYRLISVDMVSVVLIKEGQRRRLSLYEND